MALRLLLAISLLCILQLSVKATTIPGDVVPEARGTAALMDVITADATVSLLAPDVTFATVDDIVPAGPNTADPVQPDHSGLSITLAPASGSDTLFDNVRPYLVTATLVNDNPGPTAVLLHDSPFNPDGIETNIFQTTTEFTPAEQYIGSTADGGSSLETPNHISTLQPGQSISTTFDIQKYLHFEHSGSFIPRSPHQPLLLSACTSLRQLHPQVCWI